MMFSDVIADISKISFKLFIIIIIATAWKDLGRLGHGGGGAGGGIVEASMAHCPKKCYCLSDSNVSFFGIFFYYY